MRRKLVVEFTKMNGAGNDFVVLDNRFYNFDPSELSDMALSLCRRRLSVGADGLLALNHPSVSGSHFRMGYFNADGSAGSMCGNGARCLAWFARHAGMADSTLHFESAAGLFAADILEGRDGDRVRLYFPEGFEGLVGEPESMVLEGGTFQVAQVWSGTEHAVVMVDDPDDVDVGAVGRTIRHHDRFQPKGTNADFVSVMDTASRVDGPRVRVRTYERGVETETLSCGTGAVACALIVWHQGFAESDSAVRVDMRGGQLTVGHARLGAGERLYLEGEVRIAFRGTLDW